MIEAAMKRRPSLELLDTDAGTEREVAGSLRDLQMFNEWFGGIRTTEILFRRARRKSATKRFPSPVAAEGGLRPHHNQRRFPQI
jgi:hypothetical protein